MAEPTLHSLRYDPTVFWFYGLSGSGKTALSTRLATEWKQAGVPCLVLDGDQLRGGLCADLGFSLADRAENIRRAAEIARLACHQGLVVLAAFITPTAELRATARRIVAPHPFHEIYLACDYATAACRDVKGLYARAAAGAVKQFTGKDAAFETPAAPDLRVDTQAQTLEQCLQQTNAWAFPRLTRPAPFSNPLTE